MLSVMQQIFDLFSINMTEFVNWINDMVVLFSGTRDVYDSSGTLIESSNVIYDIPWPVLIPWKAVFGFIAFIVFIFCIFKLLRSVLCKTL